MTINIFKTINTLFTLVIVNVSYSQTILNADNTANNTYELINSVFVKNGSNSTAVETPDQVCVSANSTNGSHPEFGRHITEVFDATLNKNVLAFFAHVNEDNDVSTTKTDRQRTEIKTFGSSPDSLKGVVGEIVQYKWRFKIPVGWQPSSAFTHIHQVKAVDGDDSDPIFTLTLRKGTPNKLELIYVPELGATTDKKVIANLSLFEGIWVEATETITIGSSGTYSIDIVKVSDNSSLLSYSNSNIKTIRPDNSFIRPKWGIYRSIATPSDLRNEVLYFSDFSIQELSALPVSITAFTTKKVDHKIILSWQTNSESNLSHYTIQKSTDGINFYDLGNATANNKAGSFSYSFVDQYPAFGHNYYKLISVDVDGKMGINEIRTETFGVNILVKVFPNPSTGKVTVSGVLKNDIVNITDVNGKTLISKEVKADAELNLILDGKKSGIYLITVLRNQKNIFRSKLLVN